MDAINLSTLVAGFQPVYGAPISIRPLRTDDFEIEEAFIRGLSAATRSDRLLGGARAITREYVARLTQVDYPRELALAATVMLEERETLIGVARYARDAGDESCEFALVVADAWQGHGVGRRLLEALIAAARRHGIPRMMGYVLSMNRAMLGLARRLGFRAQRSPGDATLTEVVLDFSTVH